MSNKNVLRDRMANHTNNQRNIELLNTVRMMLGGPLNFFPPTENKAKTSN